MSTFTTAESQIEQFYVGYFGRAADPAGMQYWLTQYAGGMSLSAIAASFAVQTESTNLYPYLAHPLVDDANHDNAIAFITKVYQELFNRAPDAGGQAYWLNQLVTANGSPAAVANFIINVISGATTGGSDDLTLQAKVQVADSFTNALSATNQTFNSNTASEATLLVTGTTSSNAAAQIAAGAAWIATGGNVVNQVFTLTTGLDAPGTGAFATAAITGSNNLIYGTFNAQTGGTAGTGATYNAGDVITGAVGSTGNTLNLTDLGSGGLGTVTSIAATVSNISNLNVNGSQAETVNTASGFSGLTQLNVNVVDATIGGSTVTAAGTTAINFADSSTTAANTDSIQGGQNVVVTETGVAAAGIVNVGTATAPTGTVAVTETTTAFGGVADAINVTGGTTITVTANLAAGTGATTNTGGVITINGSAATTAVTVNQSNTATAAAAVPGVTGVVAVGAVAAAPGVQGVTAVTGVAAVTAVAAVQGVVDGQVVINDATAGSLTAAGTITTITLNGYGAASTISDNALTTLNLNGKPIAGGTLTITDSLTVPVTALALNLNAYSTTGTIVDATVKTLTITNTGTSSSGGFTDAALTTLNVAGSGALTLKGLSANAALATVAISGAASFSDGAATVATGLGNLGATLTSFTTTSSGSITAALNDTNQTFVGSTGQDIITVSALADATKVITGGSATNNELILDGVAYALTGATAAKVTGFQTLGVNGNVTGTIDMSILDPAASKLDIIGNSTIAFTKVATDAAIALDASSTSVSVKYVDASGVSDVVAVTMGATSMTAAALTVSDANLVGIGTLNFTTKGTFNTVDTITTLVDNGLANLNVSGTGGLTITTLNEASTQATAFTINNTETNAAGVTIATFTDINLGSLVFTGSNASTITTLNDNGAVVGITNTGTSTASVGTLTDTLLTSLTLGAGVSLGQAATADNTKGLQDSSAAGVTVSGAADNAHVTLNLTAGAGTGLTDSINLGNGNDFVTDASTLGTVNLTVGTGSNLIVLGGTNTDTTAVYNVTLGTHTLATGPDFFSVGSAGTAFATAPNLVVTGAVIGDQLTFANDGASSAAALTATAAGGTAAATITAVEAAAVAIGVHGVAYSVFGGNTYVAEDLAAGAASATNTTLVEITGTHTFTAAAGHLTILT